MEHGGDNAWEVQPCPTKLPHDLDPGGANNLKVARWFGDGYNAWYVGSQPRNQDPRL